MANAALPRRLGGILLAIGLLAAVAVAAFIVFSRSLDSDSAQTGVLYMVQGGGFVLVLALLGVGAGFVVWPTARPSVRHERRPTAAAAEPGAPLNRLARAIDIWTRASPCSTRTTGWSCATTSSAKYSSRRPPP